jgi:hypothetical protein
MPGGLHPGIIHKAVIVENELKVQAGPVNRENNCGHTERRDDGCARRN